MGGISFTSLHMGDHGRVRIIHSHEEFTQQLQNAANLVVVDWSAQWCGPCNQIFPLVVQLSNDYPDVTFLKVDVDENRALAQAHGIRAMPTFHFFKKSAKVDELQGADAAGLESRIQKHRDTVKNWGGGHRLSDAPPNANVLRPNSNRPQPSGGAPAPQPSEDVLPMEHLLVGLMDMGFSVGQAQQALIATNNASIDQAIEWIFAHPESANAVPQTVESSKADLSLEKKPGDGSPAPATEEQPSKPEKSWEEREQAMKERLAAAREARKKQEEEEEQQREINRIKNAAASAQTKRSLEEQKRKDEIAAAKRKRLEEKRQKAEIRAKIQAAKEERKAAPVETKKHTTCSLKIRLPSGKTVEQDFKPSDTLYDVYKFLQTSHAQAGNFSICTNYPRKAFTGEALKTTLQDAELVPRAAVTVSYN